LLPDSGAHFTRDYGCTEAEWRGWLPRATHGQAWAFDGAAAASVQVGGGTLHLAWRVLEPRRIALISLPRLEVDFAYAGVDDATRQAFQRRFDASLQRGGG
jgi:hypothetical protein